MAKVCFVVPGFMASGLKRDAGAHGLFDTDVIWFNAYNLSTGGAEELTLADNGTDPLPAYSSVSPNNRAVQFVTFEPITERLTLDGWTPFLLHYDWRKRPSAIAAAMVAVMNQSVIDVGIDQPEGVTEIAVIGHSLGGLIARLLYPLVPQSIRDLWHTTIFLGTPHGGSYDAALALNMQGGWWSISFGNWIVQYLADTWRDSRSPRLLAMARSWPGLWSLLPRSSPAEFAQIDSFTAGLLDAQNWQSSDAAVTRGLAYTGEFWTALDAARATEPENQISVFATGRTTIDQLTQAPAPATGFKTSPDLNGDGLVPDQRAQLSGTIPAGISDVGHMSMPEDPTILGKLGTWLVLPPDEPIVMVPLQQRHAPPPPPAVTPPNVPHFIAPFFPTDSTRGRRTLIRRGDP